MHSKKISLWKFLYCCILNLEYTSVQEFETVYSGELDKVISFQKITFFHVQFRSFTIWLQKFTVTLPFIFFCASATADTLTYELSQTPCLSGSYTSGHLSFKRKSIKLFNSLNSSYISRNYFPMYAQTT